MMQTRTRATLTALRQPANLGRTMLALMWCTDGLLKLQPFFRHHFVSGVIDPSATGQPAAIAHLITSIGSLVEPHQAIFAGFAALTELSIGVGLLFARTVKPAVAISCLWAVNVWLTGEGLGGLFAGATPNPLTGIVGTAPLYVVAGLLVWPRPQGDATREFGLIGRNGARVVWAALWLGTAVFWLFPANGSAGALGSALKFAPSGAGWLTSLHTAAGHAVGDSGMAVAVVLAVASAGIGLSVLNGRGIRVALWSSIAISLLLWVLGEGVGGLFTGQASKLGTGPMMVVLAVLLMPLAAPRDARSAPVAVRAQEPLELGHEPLAAR